MKLTIHFNNGKGVSFKANTTDTDDKIDIEYNISESYLHVSEITNTRYLKHRKIYFYNLEDISHIEEES